MMKNVKWIETPVGMLKAVEEDGFLTELDFARKAEAAPCSNDSAIEEPCSRSSAAAELCSNDSVVLMETERQLRDYFSGKRKSFDLPIRTEGTAFQKAVWDALLAIPYGEARTYGEIAAAVGKPGAARAVGTACHDNPISIVIPCHRVLGAGDRLNGYGGGLANKARLLDLEGASYRK